MKTGHFRSPQCDNKTVANERFNRLYDTFDQRHAIDFSKQKRIFSINLLHWCGTGRKNKYVHATCASCALLIASVILA